MKHLFQYKPGRSIIHHLDPRVKILSLFGLGLLIFQAGPVMTLWLGLFLVFAARLGSLGGRDLIQVLKPLRYFFLLLFFVHLLFTGGRPIELLHYRLPAVTYDGLYQGVITTSQFILLVIATSIMTMATSPGMIMAGLEKLFSPLRRLGLPVHDITMMISIALNFVPLILGEITKIKEAQSARGAAFESRSPIIRVRLFLSLFTPVCLNTFRQADELVLAMEGRGYCRGPRTVLKELKLTRSDYLAFLIMTLIAVIGFCELFFVTL